MNQLFFKINLNKYGELKQKQERSRRTFLNTVIIFVLGTAILYGFALYQNSILKNKFNNRMNLLKSIRKEISEYKDSGDYLSTKDLQRLANLSSDRVFWAMKLVALSEKTNNEIAITHFSYKMNTLSLFGITQLDKGKKEHVLINDFISELRANKQISTDFPEIKFVKSRRDYEKDIEIVRFQVDCKKADNGGRK
ncbi:MAG: hypothetical protein U9N34_10085 [Candidatus Cloacimonadota bacterium]|nr:hypothetical protein [Candidatus Cloacimonadota bacterium]